MKCPKCGALEKRRGDLFASYECGSTLFLKDSGAGPAGAWSHPDSCRIRELEQENARLREAVSPQPRKNHELLDGR